MKGTCTIVGLDVHEESIDVTIAEDSAAGEVRRFGAIGGVLEAVAKLPRRLRRKGRELQFVHELEPRGSKPERWDTLLVFGPRRSVEQLYELDDFLPLQEIDLRLRLNRRWWLHAGTLVGVIGAATLFGVNILSAALVGVVLLLASRTVKVQRVYRSVQWSVFFLLAATIPLGVAVEKSGLATRVGDWIASRGGDAGPWLALSLLYLVTMILTEMLSNASTAVLMVPVAMSTAAALGVDPKPLLMAVCFAASNGFVTPIGYQTNAMVYGAGNYRYRDFLAAGIPLNLLFWVLSSALIPVFWSF